MGSKTPTDVSLGDTSLKTSTKETLLGILIDSKVSFEHVSSTSIKAMSLKKRRTLMKAFIESHFNYCPLILMFHSRIMNNKINRIHERALRLVFHDLSPSIILFSILRKTFYATLGHTVNFIVEIEHMVFSL